MRKVNGVVLLSYGVIMHKKKGADCIKIGFTPILHTFKSTRTHSPVILAIRGLLWKVRSLFSKDQWIILNTRCVINEALLTWGSNEFGGY